MNALLEKLNWFLCDHSKIYRAYRTQFYNRRTDGNGWRWQPFTEVVSAFDEWKRLMTIPGYDEWFFWMSINMYCEHDEMGYFSHYPNEQDY
jgi:hypothetical protein